MPSTHSTRTTQEIIQITGILSSPSTSCQPTFFFSSPPDVSAAISSMTNQDSTPRAMTMEDSCTMTTDIAFSPLPNHANTSSNPELVTTSPIPRSDSSQPNARPCWSAGAQLRVTRIIAPQNNKVMLTPQNA